MRLTRLNSTRFAAKIVVLVLAAFHTGFASAPQRTVLMFIIDGLQTDAARVAMAHGAANMKFFFDNGVWVEEVYCSSPSGRLYLPDNTMPWGTAAPPNVAMHTGTHVFESRLMDDVFLAARRANIKSVFSGSADNYKVFNTPYFCFAANNSDSLAVEFALDHLRRDKVRLLSLHIQETRRNWTGPEDKTRPDSKYQQYLLTVDHYLGKFVQSLKSEGLWDSTLVIVSSDHGMGLTRRSDHPASVLPSWLPYMNFYGPSVKRGKSIPYAETPDLAILIQYYLNLSPLQGLLDANISLEPRGATGTLLSNIFEGNPAELWHPRLIRRYLESKNWKPSDDYAEYRTAMIGLIKDADRGGSRNVPDVLLLSAEALELARASFRADPLRPLPAVRKLLEDAAAALGAEPVSVMLKQEVPPSGDKHDFMSLGPYWWPDSTKANGLPYIRRDGERNPECEAVGDNHNLDIMVSSVETLALAFAVTQDERYAKKAIRDLNVWFLDEATHMNPNLNYAQAVKGLNEGRGIGIIETYGFRHLIDALILLQQSGDWNRAIDRDIRAWFAKYLTWLLESKNGKNESAEKNNHGSAYDVQTSCIALFLGQQEVSRKIIADVGAKRIAVQVEPDGSQPLELARTKSWGYSNMNLDALLELAHLGDRVGVDLWHFETPDGRSIRDAVDYMMPFAVGRKKWTYSQIVPFHRGRMYYALTISALKFKDKTYGDAASVVLDDEVRSSKVMFSVPPR